MILSRLYRSDKQQYEGDPLSKEEQRLASFDFKKNKIRAFQLLEKILFQYKHDVRYKNSPRYLRLWLVYVFYLKETEKAFFILPILFGLIENQICDKLAILYEAIAYELYQQKRYTEVEKTLILGLKRRAEPIKRLNRAIHQFKTNGTFDFHLRSYQWRHFVDQKSSMMHKTKTLREQLEWLDIKLQHHIRLDVLKDCHKEGDILSIEELRAKHDRYHLVRSCPRIIHPAHALVVQLPHRPGLIDQQIQTHSTEHYTVFDHDASFIQRQLDAWFQTTKHNKKQAKQDLKLIQLSQDKFHVVRKINEGGMAHIYLVQNYLSTMLVLKIQQPAHAWEYYILSQLKQRAVNGFHLLGLHGFYRFTDRSFLIMDYVRHGTLLDALNLYRPQHNAMPESVVLLLTLQLLKQLYLLHWQMSITHNDLKLDNVMVCLSDQDMVGIMLVDYGYAIDTRIIGGHHTLCKANWPPACPASDFPLLNKAYYPVHADYWQLATMVHWLLFGCPMRTLTEKHSYRIQQKIKRYWHRQLWNRFFQFMLNPPVPKQDAIRSLLSQFEMIVYQDVFENNKSDLKAFVALLLDKHRVDER